MLMPRCPNLLPHHRATLLILIAVVLGSGIASCTNEVTGNNPRKNSESAQDTTHTMTIEEALEKHTEDLLAIPGVEGVAQSRCDGQPCITVYVLKKTPKIERTIPDTLEGYPVTLIEAGKFETQSAKGDSSRSQDEGP